MTLPRCPVGCDVLLADRILHVPLEQMMHHLKLADGSRMTIRNVTLPRGQFVRLQPHLTQFTQLDDHRAMYAAPAARCPDFLASCRLETALWHFACLSQGTTI